jgi:hypothetical protein
MNLLEGQDLKVTYLLGAGASYNSVPIWKEQGNSMIFVANKLQSKLNSLIDDLFEIPNKDNISEFVQRLKEFGEKAIEFGSIDIYAKRLYLIEDFQNLKKLKHCISVYFDLWENFYFSDFTKPDGTYYNYIDKRYYSLLSLLLEKGKNRVPVINENVNFITWNYDLQLENSLDSFLSEKSIDYTHLNSIFNFFGDDPSKQRIVHLNGFRGVFDYENKIVENFQYKNLIDEKKYFESLSENLKDFRKISYQKTIKYAWESASESVSLAKDILEKTNILVIIGYSFPAFNRLIDTDLFSAFKKNKNRRVVYQDPYANDEILELFFNGIQPKHKKVLKDVTQFYIPEELMVPFKSGRDFR